MDQYERIDAGRALGWWIVMMFIIMVVGLILSIALTPLLLLTPKISLSTSFTFISSELLYGTIWGFAFGIGQRRVLRRDFYASAHGWIWASVIGTIIGMLTTKFGLLYQPGSSTITLACVSIAQWFILRREVRDAWLWIVACTVSMFACEWLIRSTSDWSIFGRYEFFIATRIILGTVVLAVVPGCIMLHLFINRLRDSRP